MKKFLLTVASAVLMTATATAVTPSKEKVAEPTDTVTVIAEEETVAAAPGEILRLTEEDYRAVAEELGVEVAAIKAVVDIEAGRSHEGFSAPGRPLVNFDMSMFRRAAGRRGINLSRYSKSHPSVFRSSTRGSQASVYNRVQAARTIDNTAAVEGTFWGMFQIGGFNWRKCGAKDVNEFVELMSRSERDQLELFAKFIINTGLAKHLQTKNWAAFARGYNGPSYASRGYHTRMASAYQRHKAAEAKTNGQEEQ